MQRAKLLAVFSAALLALAVAAVPASAWFQARTNGATQGHAGSLGPSTLTFPGGGAITCTKWSGAWHIESSGKVQGRQKTEQFLTKAGPHLGLTISKWEGCSAGGTVPAEVSPCILQVEQPVKGVNKGTGSVAESCKVKIPAIGCEFEAPVAGNEALPEAGEETFVLNIKIKIKIKIKIEVAPPSVSSCEAAGILSNKETTFSAEALAESVELI
jgi:hypothetical protein